MEVRVRHTIPFLIALVTIAPANGVSAQVAAPPQRDLMDTTCGDYLAATRAADLGQNPSAERRRQHDEALDDLVNSMLWLHGYQSGLAGREREPQPLTREWMIENIGRLATVCRDNSTDGRMRLVDAVKRL
jgi:ribosome modulation factor